MQFNPKQFEEMMRPLDERMRRDREESRRQGEQSWALFERSLYWAEFWRIIAWAVGFSLAFWLNYGLYCLIVRRQRVRVELERLRAVLDQAGPRPEPRPAASPVSAEPREEFESGDDVPLPPPPPIDDRLPPPRLNLPENPAYRRLRGRGR